MIYKVYTQSGSIVEIHDVDSHIECLHTGTLTLVDAKWRTLAKFLRPQAFVVRALPAPTPAPCAPLPPTTAPVPQVQQELDPFDDDIPF